MKKEKLPTLQEQYIKQINQNKERAMEAVKLLFDLGILKEQEKYMLKDRILIDCYKKGKKYVNPIL